MLRRNLLRILTQNIWNFVGKIKNIPVIGQLVGSLLVPTEVLMRIMLTYNIHRCIIVRVTLYNFRRANEVPRMTLEQFENQTKGSEAVMTVAAGLKDTEKQIAPFMESVVMKGTLFLQISPNRSTYYIYYDEDTECFIYTCTGKVLDMKW